MSNELIDEFMARYMREYDHYAKVAQICHERCTFLLRERGIRCIVSSRAKDSDRLRAKIEGLARNGFAPASINDVHEKIRDMAGVRIAIYFPGDMAAVEGVIRGNFKCDGDNDNFPSPARAAYTKQFVGYKAKHFRVRLTPVLDTASSYCETEIEIQVASVLMHAWAEVEHDLVYKPLSGELSAAEHAILDEINGLALIGEIALQRLQDAIDARVNANKSLPFGNHYELVRYISDRMAQIPNDTEWAPSLGHTVKLFQFLSKIGKANADSLDGYLAEMTPNTGPESLTDQIALRAIGDDDALLNDWNRTAQPSNSQWKLRFDDHFRYFCVRLHEIYRSHMDEWQLEPIVGVSSVDNPEARALFRGGLISERTFANLMDFLEAMKLAREGQAGITSEIRNQMEDLFRAIPQDIKAAYDRKQLEV